MRPQEKKTNIINYNNASGESWSESEVTTLRLYLLDRTLEMLAQARTEKARQELLRWVLDTGRDAFSFTVCTETAGCDPDLLRQNILRVLQSAQTKTLLH